MDQIKETRSREDRIQALASAYGVDKAEATIYIDLAEGKTMGDIESDPPLTAEEREKLGLGRSFLDMEAPISDDPRIARQTA